MPLEIPSYDWLVTKALYYCLLAADTQVIFENQSCHLIKNSVKLSLQLKKKSFIPPFPPPCQPLHTTKSRVIRKQGERNLQDFKDAC